MKEYSIQKFWKKFKLNKTSIGYVHKDDKPFLRPNQCKVFTSSKQYLDHLKTSHDRDEKNFHTGLLPSPFIGNLNSARIIIVFLNPGFDDGDYYVEENSKFKKSLISNLKSNTDSEFPLFTLNPEFSWTAANRWIVKKFSPFFKSCKSLETLSYYEKLSLQMIRLACSFLLQMFILNLARWKKQSFCLLKLSRLRQQLIHRIIKLISYILLRAVLPGQSIQYSGIFGKVKVVRLEVGTLSRGAIGRTAIVVN